MPQSLNRDGDALKDVYERGHDALNEWGAYWNLNHDKSYLGYPTITPFERLRYASGRPIEIETMPQRVREVDEIILRQHPIILSAATSYYLVQHGESLASAVKTFQYLTHQTITRTKLSEYINLLKYQVGLHFLL